MDLMKPIEANALDDLALQISERMTNAVKGHLLQAFAPDMTKTLRLFSVPEAADLLNTTPQFLRKCHSDGTLPEPAEQRGTRKYYSAEELWSFRQILEKKSSTPGRYLPWRREGEALQVWQLMNFKGGCAKTTTTAHIAHYLALNGFRVLLIDMDPQASLTGMCGLDPHQEFGATTIYDAITLNDPVPMSEVIRETFMPGLHIAPSQLILSEFKMEARADKNFFLRLQDAIAQVQDRFDVVLIDSPPELDILTLTGMAAATSIIVPMTPSMMDVTSTAQFMRLVSSYIGVINQHDAKLDYDHFRFLITRDEPTDGPSQQLVAFLRALFPNILMQATCYKSTAVSDATMLKQTVYELDRSDITRSTYDRARASMDAVGAEIRAMMETSWGRQ
ncbi:plasmid partitioning protein RepA (plasmid) [Phaeobacter inhibens]|uniref:plasmid partitioning protein RepA n=1 Tax=Phaeobacter inhibens TaxID=221822 RepID=UPI000C99FD23|nr:plasmid partitioning protein RepA [Phaeobacter inhibens]AUQ92772.1 plasmid partitioning protein RepA [Phaeobacter inhibens]